MKSRNLVLDISMVALVVVDALTEFVVVKSPNPLDILEEEFSRTPARFGQANAISTDASLAMPLMLQVMDVQLTPVLQLLILSVLRFSINSLKLSQVVPSS